MRYVGVFFLCFMLLVDSAEAGKVRVYYKADKSVIVVYPAPNARKEGENEQAFMDRVCAKAAKTARVEGRPYDDIDSSQLPSRDYRGAWEGTKGNPITISLSKSAAKREEKKESQLKAPVIKALLKVLADRFSIDIAVLRQQIKDGMD